MIDIEEILREAATEIGIDISSIELMAAADEIERLRDENEKLRIDMKIIYLAVTELPIDEQDTFTVRYRRIKEQYERNI